MLSSAFFFLSPQITGHTSVYINEPRLSDFKQVLNKAGIQAEFAGGVLICNNVVAVRRVSKTLVLVAIQPGGSENWILFS